MEHYHQLTTHAATTVRNFLDEAHTWKTSCIHKIGQGERPCQEFHKERTTYTQRRTFIDDHLGILHLQLRMDTEAGTQEERKNLRLKIQGLKRELYQVFL
ncbi:MAG: hypothetical protein Q7R96_04225 [Nanoarchaeota archaeon]|nr:hypothetical protein [Nanoarchaeota archaeon]